MLKRNGQLCMVEKGTWCEVKSQNKTARLLLSRSRDAARDVRARRKQNSTENQGRNPSLQKTLVNPPPSPNSTSDGSNSTNILPNPRLNACVASSQNQRIKKHRGSKIHRITATAFRVGKSLGGKKHASLHPKLTTKPTCHQKCHH